MSVSFSFTLSDAEAENFIDILNDNKTMVLAHLIMCEDRAQRAWFENRLTYVRALQAKVLKGQQTATREEEARVSNRKSASSRAELPARGEVRPAPAPPPQSRRSCRAPIRDADLSPGRLEDRQAMARGRRGGPVLFVVTIQDKMLYGEPDIAIAVVDAVDEETARRAAHPTIEQLADAGRGRCVPHARVIEPGRFYRLGAVVRLPRDPDTDTDGGG